MRQYESRDFEWAPYRVDLGNRPDEGCGRKEKQEVRGSDKKK